MTSEATSQPRGWRWIRRKESWRSFTLKCGLALLLLALFWGWFFSRFTIGIDIQKETCLPGYHLFLVDTLDKDIARDKVFAYRAKGIEPFFKDGQQMVKYIRGVPGDHVEINVNDAVLINGKPVEHGLALARLLNQPEADFRGQKTLGDNEYWFMGTSPISFDSRYFGTIKYEQIIGRAYPIL